MRRAAPGQALAKVIADDAAEAATPHGLIWVSEDAPGIRRVRVGDGFEYRGPDGKRLRDTSTLQRIRSRAIPPAYENVWICTRPNGHLQATGRDAPYVHPRVLATLAATAEEAVNSEELTVARRVGLAASERRLLAFLSRP